MSKLALPKFVINLDFYGEVGDAKDENGNDINPWQNCYIKIERPKAQILAQMEQEFQSENIDSTKVLNEVRELLKSNFVEGKGLNEKYEMIDIEVEDFDEVFDMKFFTIALRKLVEGNYR